MRFVLICFLVFILIAYSSAQKFQKGNFDFTLGLGISAYVVESNDLNNNVDNLINAASVLIPVKCTYSVMDRLSVGMIIQNDRFIVDHDSSKFYGKMFHIGFSGQYRIINSQNNTLNFDLNYGYSFLDWTLRSREIGIYAQGRFFNTAVSYYHFWTNTIGCYFSVNYNRIIFPVVENSDYQILTVNYGVENFYFDITGIQIYSGLCVKF